MAQSQPATGSAEIIDILSTFEDVTRFRPAPGQYVVHPAHQVGGYYILLRGCLCLAEVSGSSRRTASAKTLEIRCRESRPLLIPPFGEVDLTSAYALIAQAGAELLFVPRSLVRETPTLLDLLKGAGLEVVSLQLPGKTVRQPSLVN